MGCNIIYFENGASAFICGAPLDHECNEKGPIIYGFTNGFNGTLFEAAKAQKINLNMCDDDKLHFLLQKDIGITSASVSCSICGGAAIDNAFKF